MDGLVRYELRDSVATLTLDDGKVNVLSPGMFAAINEGLDRAGEARAVVLAGREGIFSGGFDLKTLRAGGPDAEGMVRSGFRLAMRLLSFPVPVVAACTGHAIAMGAFLVCSCDVRIGAAGPYRLTANEVAIGLTIPTVAAEILRNRLTPSALNRAVALAEVFTPDNAVESGFLDRVVAPERVLAEADEVAHRLAQLDSAAHAGSKLRLRKSTLDTMAASMAAEYPESDRAPA